MDASRINPTGIFSAVAAAVIIFMAAVLLPKILIEDKIFALSATQVTELLLALLAILFLGKGRFAEYGFRMPRPDRPMMAAIASWIPIALLSLGVGAAASLLMLSLGGSGNPLLKQLSFLQIVLFVWINSSIIEEVFTRGFLQGHLIKSMDISKKLPVIRVDYPTLISALFFSMMHLVLILSGVDFYTVAVTLLFTFTLGLIAGTQFSRTGSLLPAIGVHILANIGGVIGGIIYAVYTILTGGELPGM